MVEERPRLGVSACLLGQEVRYDGSHRLDPWLTGPLAEFVEFVPTCPEMAIGLGAPRPPVRLVGDPQRPRALGVDDPSLDVTRALERFSLTRVAELGEIDGHVLKRGSPSCGMERVKVYGEPGRVPSPTGMGLFARALAERYPTLPLEEEGRLNDPLLRENFVNRLFVHHRWQTLVRGGLTAERLIGFHSDHKYLVMAHSQAACRRLGKMLADLSDTDLHTLGEGYILELMTALKRRVERKHHVNVLQHILGYLKKRIDREDRSGLAGSIEAYRNGQVPLVDPITLLRHYFRVHPDPYMARQVYLHPCPDELGLRNAI